MKAPTPAPSVGDLILSAGTSGWPAETYAGVTLGPGEQSWRRGAEGLTGDQRLAFWEARGKARFLAERGGESA